MAGGSQGTWGLELKLEVMGVGGGMRVLKRGTCRGREKVLCSCPAQSPCSVDVETQCDPEDCSNCAPAAVATVGTQHSQILPSSTPATGTFV